MFKVRSKAVIHEFLENEVILADLEVGIYCSIRESGIPIWQLLASGHSIEEALSLLQEKYPTSPLETVPPFINQLVEENLLIPTSSQEKIIPADLFWPSQFHPPIFAKYEEMRNLLQLDPIHEVEEQGWPARGDLV
jgi:hypothetical protein